MIAIDSIEQSFSNEDWITHSCPFDQDWCWVESRPGKLPDNEVIYVVCKNNRWMIAAQKSDKSYALSPCLQPSDYFTLQFILGSQIGISINWTKNIATVL